MGGGFIVLLPVVVQTPPTLQAANRRQIRHLRDKFEREKLGRLIRGQFVHVHFIDISEGFFYYSK